MLHTLWLFLKILLITVLILLILAVVILLLVLFVPVRYRLYGEKHENIEARAKVSWLGFVLCFRAKYDSDGLNYNLKTFGGTLINSDMKKEKKPDEISKEGETEETGDKSENTSDTGIESKENNVPDSTVKSENVSDAGDEADNDTENTEIVTDEDFKPKKQGILIRIGKLIDKLAAAVAGRIKKITSGYNKLKNKSERFRKFLRSSNTKRALGAAKDVLVKLLNHIKPTKIKGQITYGTGDPASTGTQLGYVSIVFPFYYDKIDITPDFENKIIDGEIYIRGRIRIVNILIYALKILVNKYVRRAVKQFKSISGGNRDGKRK